MSEGAGSRARPLCAGGCYHEAHTRYGSTEQPNLHYCDWIRSWTNTCLEVYGTLAEKNYVLKPEEQYLEFKLRDSRGEVMPVTYRGVIPGNFDQATSIVAIGHYRSDHFEAEQLLVKCPSKYQAEAEKAKRRAS